MSRAIEYAGHPRGFRPEAPEAVHYTADSTGYAPLLCGRRRLGYGVLLTEYVRQVTCRECRNQLEDDRG